MRSVTPGAKRRFSLLTGFETMEPRRMLSAVNVLTGAYNNSRTGDDVGEESLRATTVTSGHFALLTTLPADGSVVGQPLEIEHVFIGKQIKANAHDVTYFATTNDTVYAYDVNSGALLWKTSLLKKGQ